MFSQDYYESFVWAIIGHFLQDAHSTVEQEEKEQQKQSCIRFQHSQ